MDNNTYIDQYYLGEPAFSVYIEDGAEKILFDTGYSDAFLRNAEQMQVDMNALRMSRHKTVSGIIGGFHLLKKNQQLTETIRFLDYYTNGMLYPCHCVSFAAKHEMMNTLPLTEVGGGLEVEVE